MSFEKQQGRALDYRPCRYGASRLVFRGPAKQLDGPYVVMIGSTEVYGRFVEYPVSEILQASLRRTVVNLGQINAGIDAFLHDPAVLEICRGAEATIIQVMGAQNMSNRIYTVHPRHNDRVVKPSGFLRTLYRNIDFAEYHYARHLLSALHRESRERFELVREELSTAWLARMRSLIEAIGGRVWLLWMADHAPAETAQDDPLGPDPLFVSAPMLEELAPLVENVVKVVATREEIDAGRDRMVHLLMEEPIAREMLGPVVHQSAARQLAEALDALR